MASVLLWLFSLFFLFPPIATMLTELVNRLIPLSDGVRVVLTCIFYLLLIPIGFKIVKLSKEQEEKERERQLKIKQARIDRFDSVEFTDDGLCPILSISPVEILVKVGGRPRREIFTLHGFFLTPQGHPVFDLRDEFGDVIHGYYSDFGSLITYNKESYRTFDDFLNACTYSWKVKEYKQSRADFLKYVDKVKNGRS